MMLSSIIPERGNSLKVIKIKVEEYGLRLYFQPFIKPVNIIFLDTYEQKDILITSGTGQGSLSQIIDYSESTKVATVTPNFTTAPSSGSGYLIIDNEFPVEQRPVFEYDLGRISTLQLPDKFYPMGDEDYGEFILNCPPDKNYGARLRYYASLQRLDLDSTLMSSLYARWRSIWVDGIFVKRLQDADDQRAVVENEKWIRNMKSIIQRETYGKDLSGIQDRVTDYV